ncbi:MAG: DUF4266 domain-containing protein [Nevskiales bacterium]
MKFPALCLLGVFVLAVSSGCAVKDVKAWERGYLAQPEMAADPDPLASEYREHVYFSKEAAFGGATAGGGGCGCN